MAQDVYFELMDDFEEYTDENMRLAAEELLEDANEECPYDTGYLQSTGMVVKTSQGYEVVYTADYAIYVHENPNGKGYKWLERTADNNADKYESIMRGEYYD